ncbi:MAG TPA: DUF1905 domain-containing protein [Propionibacteriaceae bacterium]|jgi:hypothetical protein|nr:DUF1905 domain-containing protein [Propionibacteriaceae bacterium]
MAGDRYEFRGELWEYDGPAAWHFVSLPAETAADIRERLAQNASAFGSIRVQATVGSTQWTTSLFADKVRGTYLLPVKKGVRAVEDLETGDVVLVTLQI